MGKHTPGPWIANGQEVEVSAEVERLAGEIVAETFSTDDARLIAAAPDLLVAAKAVIGWWDEGLHPKASMADALRAAIAAAEGE